MNCGLCRQNSSLPDHGPHGRVREIGIPTSFSVLLVLAIAPSTDANRQESWLMCHYVHSGQQSMVMWYSSNEWGETVRRKSEEKKSLCNYFAFVINGISAPGSNSPTPSCLEGRWKPRSLGGTLSNCTNPGGLHLNISFYMRKKNWNFLFYIPCYFSSPMYDN